MVLTPEEYANITATPCVRPTRPPALTITPLTPTHEVIRLQQEHDREIDTYNDCMSVERQLKKKIVAAIDSDFLDEITDRTTDSINLNISAMLTHLFNQYGYVEPETLAEKETKLMTYFWDPSEPTVIMYNKIDNLINLARAAGLPKSDEQVVNIGIHLIKKTNDFENALIAWYNRHPTQRTY